MRLGWRQESKTVSLIGKPFEYPCGCPCSWGRRRCFFGAGPSWCGRLHGSGRATDLAGGPDEELTVRDIVFNFIAILLQHLALKLGIVTTVI